MPQLNEALKNRKENSPANLLPSESSKLTFPVNRNLPSARSPAVCFSNSRNPHLSLFRTLAWFAHSTTNDYLLLNTRRSKCIRRGSTPRPPHPTSRRLPLRHDNTLCCANSPHSQAAIWMAIVEQLSLGRVCQEEGERNGDASWSRRGTDPALLYRFRMTYTTRPP
uniref:Uncharacterized protein n=1 Tax=Heterorhabditis bacteriophora TaxID=37862 RepID=A0A1I7X3X1_HETBA